MTINYKGEDLELKFTFNSFRYLEDFDVQDLEDVQHKIFKMFSISRQLLMAALNKEPSRKFTFADVDAILEPHAEDGSIVEIFGGLSELLVDSGFFKSLQAMGERAQKA